MATALAPAGDLGSWPTGEPTRRPGPRPTRRPGRHLRPVERPAPRRSPAVPALVGVGIVIAALLALAAMHAVLIGGQLRLDEMRRDVAAESESIRRLNLQVAELESPDRMLETARTRLGMVQPTEVGYLAPVGVDVGTDAPVRVAAATTPPDPEPAAQPASSASAHADAPPSERTDDGDAPFEGASDG